MFRAGRGAGGDGGGACSATLGYGMVKGDHVPTVIAALKDARDQLANAAGFRITSMALGGEHHISREEILGAAGVTDRSSLLFLDVEETRERLKTNPWIADATVLKLYPGELQIQHQGARGLRALAAGRPGLGHRRRRHRARALSRPRMRQLPLVVGRGAEAQAKDFLTLLDRYPRHPRAGARVDPGRRSGAGTCG